MNAPDETLEGILENIPDELKIEILSYLGEVELRNVSSINTYYNKLTKEEDLYKNMLRRKYNIRKKYDYLIWKEMFNFVEWSNERTNILDLKTIKKLKVSRRHPNPTEINQI